MLKFLGVLVFLIATLSCSKQALQLSTSKGDSIKDPTAGDASSEISYSGALMIDSIKSEMVAMRYSLDQITTVVNAAKTEVSLASNLSIESSRELSLDGEGKSLRMASIAVAKGSIRALKETSLPEDAGILFQLANSARPEQLSMATIIKGQTKGMGLVKSRGKIAGMSSVVLAQATSEMASTALSTGAKTGMITSDNAPQMISAIAKSLFGNLKSTSMELDAEKIIPSFSNSLSGLKQVNLLKEALILVTQSMISESISGIKANNLESMTAEILPNIISNTMVGTYSVAGSSENFASAAAEVGKSALSSVNQLGLIKSKDDGSTFATLVFSSSIKSMDKIPDWNVDQLTNIAVAMQQKAMESAKDLGFSGNDTADILVNATVSMVKSMGALDRIQDLVVANDTLTQSFNRVTEATTKDLSSSIEGVSKDYSAAMQTAVSTAATEGAATSPTVQPTQPAPVPGPTLAIPTLITRVAPTMNRSIGNVVAFTIGSAVPGQTIKFYSDSSCTTLLGQGVYTSSAVTLPITLAAPGAYFFYVKSFDASLNFSACANTGETYVLDNSASSPSATLVSPSAVVGNSNLVTLGLSMLEANATVEIYSDSLCASSLLGSAVVTNSSQNLTAVLPSTGMYNFYLKQTDDLGNASPCVNSGLSYLYDTTPPSNLSLSLVNPSTSPSNLNTITLRANGTEPNSTVFLYNSASCISTPLSSKPGISGSTDFPVNGLLEGSNLFYAKQVDAAGNASSCSPGLSYILDSTPPQLPVVTLEAGQAPFSSSSSVNLRINLAETGGTLKIYSNSTCTALQTTLTASSMSMPVVLSAQTEGPHTYYATHTDSLGNTSACSTSFASWTKDSVSPTPPQLNAATSPAGPSATTNITVSGTAEAFSTVQLYSDAACSTALTGQSQTSGSGSFSVPFNIPTPNSTYMFFAKAVDQAQNSSGCSTTSASYIHNSSIPSVINVSSSTSSNLTVGGTIDISVVFSESVYVSGSPRLELELGSSPKYAYYLSGSGTSVLLFRYTVVSGDNTNDLDYKTPSALSTNGGTVKNVSPVDAVLALPSPGTPNSLGFNQNIRVDTTSPMISTILSQSTLEDIPLSPISYTITDAGNILDCVSSVTVTTSNPSVLPLANIIKSGQAPNCLLTLVSELNSFGASTVTVTVNDGITAAASTSFLFSVTSVNDLPSISDVADQSMNEDGPAMNLSVVINDVDNNLNCNTSLSATSSNSTLISNSSIVFSGTAPNCYVSLTPSPNQNGTAIITLSVTDGSATAMDTFVLNVIPVNDPPTISSFPSQVMMNEDSTAIVNVLLNDIDNSLPCSALTITNSSNSALLPPTSPNIVMGGTAPNCTLTLNPALNQNGSSTISMNAFDGTTTSGTVNFNVNVTPVDDPPTIPAIPPQVAILGFAKTFTFPVNDVDSTVSCIFYAPTSSNTAVITSAHIALASGGTNFCSVTISAMGPSPGNSNITVTVKDDTSVATQTFNITITKQWYQEAYIKAPNSLSVSSLNFGRSVSLNDSTLAVGAEFEGNAQSNITPTITTNTNSMANAGAVYVFGRTGTNWSIQSYIKASNNRAGNYFGNEVSLSGDTLAVAAYQEGSQQTTITTGITNNTANGALTSGAAYIFKRTSGNWSQEAFIKPNNSESQDFFGQSISLSGNTLLVGATQEDSSESTITQTALTTNNSYAQSGAAYLFSRMGTIWTQDAYIKASNVGADDYFGEPVAISGDTIAIGAWNEASSQNTISNTTAPASPDNSATGSGAVYIYRKDAVNQWRQEAYIKASNAEQNDNFSSSLSLSGNMLAVGSPMESSNLTTISFGTAFTTNNSSPGSGAVYMFNRSGSVWSQQAYIKASNNRTNNRFGDQLSLSGSTLAVGVMLDDSNQTTITYGPPASTNLNMSESGATFLYKYISGSWYEKNYIKPANTHNADNFGFSISLSGDSLAVGAPQESSNQTTITNGSQPSPNISLPNSGATYIYRNMDIAADPDLRIIAKTSTSITLAWNPNLGYATQVRIVPAILGDADPQDCNATQYILLNPGVNTYLYQGLNPSMRYGFRVCANNGTTTPGSVIWESTTP
ncbi:MAG: hypothetical protein WCI18_02265 [Pseudomonadota bacterium]